MEKLVSASQFSPSQLVNFRSSIRNEILESSEHILTPNFDSLSSNDIQALMNIYDQRYFDCSCRKLIAQNEESLSFRVSTRMTSTGGKTTIEVVDEQVAGQHDANRPPGNQAGNGRASNKKPQTQFSKFPKRKYEIAVSATLLFNSFESTKRPRKFAGRRSSRNSVLVAGVACADRLDALLRIFEHELLHLIEFLLWNESSCSKSRFREIAGRLFGHRQSNHQLITPTESAELKQGITVGDFVEFIHDGHKYFGYVNHISRRATVLVPHKGGARYTDGKRYAKFYVPLGHLKKGL